MGARAGGAVSDKGRKAIRAEQRQAAAEHRRRTRLVAAAGVALFAALVVVALALSTDGGDGDGAVDVEAWDLPALDGEVSRRSPRRPAISERDIFASGLANTCLRLHPAPLYTKPTAAPTICKRPSSVCTKSTPGRSSFVTKRETRSSSKVRNSPESPTSGDSTTTISGTGG